MPFVKHKVPMESELPWEKNKLEGHSIQLNGGREQGVPINVKYFLKQMRTIYYFGKLQLWASQSVVKKPVEEQCLEPASNDLPISRGSDDKLQCSVILHEGFCSELCEDNLYIINCTHNNFIP